MGPRLRVLLFIHSRSRRAETGVADGQQRFAARQMVHSALAVLRTADFFKPCQYGFRARYRLWGPWFEFEVRAKEVWRFVALLVAYASAHAQFGMHMQVQRVIEGQDDAVAVRPIEEDETLDEALRLDGEQLAHIDVCRAGLGPTELLEQTVDQLSRQRGVFWSNNFLELVHLGQVRKEFLAEIGKLNRAIEHNGIDLLWPSALAILGVHPQPNNGLLINRSSSRHFFLLIVGRVPARPLSMSTDICAHSRCHFRHLLGCLVSLSFFQRKGNEFLFLFLLLSPLRFLSALRVHREVAVFPLRSYKQQQQQQQRKQQQQLLFFTHLKQLPVIKVTPLLFIHLNSAIWRITVFFAENA